VSRITAFPYLRARPDRVKAAAWEYLAASGLAELPPALETWDYATPVLLRRHVTVDVTGVLSDCHLRADAVLGVAAIWRSSATGLQGMSPLVRLESRPGATGADLALDLDGRVLGGTLSIQTKLVVLVASPSRDRLAPGRRGSSLWNDEASVTLEGLAPRFPMVMIDFATFPLADPLAAWYLDWRSGAFQESTTAAICLYLNSAHPAILRAAGSAGSDPEGRAIVSALRHDITRALLTMALDDDEFVRNEAGYPAGTLGRSIHDLIRTYWGARATAESLRGLRSRGTYEFECEIQARVHLFRCD
jgi:hypothetical protein